MLVVPHEVVVLGLETLGEQHHPSLGAVGLLGEVGLELIFQPLEPLLPHPGLLLGLGQQGLEAHPLGLLLL